MSDDVKRIAVFGPESTGKSQLAEKLGVHFHAPVVPEYARERWDAQGGVLTLEDMLPIAREQWRREDAAAQRAAENCNLIGYRTAGAGPLIVCDTEALTTMLWSDVLYGTTPDELRRGAEKRCRGYALYLLLDVDVPFTADPQRCFPNPEDREKIMRIWRGALERRGLPYVLIQGNWPEREARAIAAIEALLRA